MKDLRAKKAEIVERHLERLSDKYIEVLKLKEHAMKDNKFRAGFGAGIFDKIFGNLDLKKDNLLNMNEEQRLQYGEQWSKDAKNLMDALKNHSEFESLLDDFDRELKIWEKELKDINKELKDCENEDKREKLESRRERVLKKV